jgi:very-short-patch-repair endonuclease
MKKETQYKRVCPNCKKILYYLTQHYLNVAIKNNKNCRNCSTKLSYTDEMRKWSSEHLKRIQTGKILSDETKEKIRKALTGKKFTDERKRNNSKSKFGKNKKPKTQEHKNKISEGVIKYKKNSGQWCSIGKNEKELLDKQEIKDNCKIIRQYQISKFLVDGYCKETNTVYEVYEKYHNKYVFKDLQRENEICNKLNCDFIIIWDKN